VNEADLKAFIKRRLGDGVIHVELTDGQMDDVIVEAKRFYAQYFGQIKAVTMTLDGRREYPEAEIASDVESVVDVFFSTSGASFKDVWAWADVEIDPFAFVYEGCGDYSMLVQYMQYREMGRRITSSDRDWEWDQAKRTLVISPVPESGVSVGVVYLTNDIDLAKVRGWEEQCVQDYALGSAMLTLGNIRTKYADKPSATGAFTMDGDILYANGDALREAAIEKARNQTMPTGLLTG